jgi:uncharacterized SAM-binding protein YcdF (DUF218 family)
MTPQDALFYLSKLVGLAIDPRSWLFAGLVAGTALLWTNRRNAGRAILTAVAIASLALNASPAAEWLVEKLEARIPPPAELPVRIDGIVVLGGDANNRLLGARPASSTLAPMRQIAFADLARRYPDAKLVYSGGSGDPLDPATTDAAGAAILLPLLGLDPARVIFESKSRNTHENAIFAFDIAKPQPGETWLLITSALHMPRALGCFRAAGWQAIPYPVGYTTLPDGEDMHWRPAFRLDAKFGPLAAAMSELAGLAAYRLLGRTDALFPAP